MNSKTPLAERVPFIISVITLLKLLVMYFFVHHIKAWEDHSMALNLFHSGSLFYDVDGARNYAFQFPVYPFMLFLIYSAFGTDPLFAAVYHVVLNAATAFVYFEMIILFFQLNPKIQIHKKILNRIVIAAVLLFLCHPAINYYCLFNVHPFAENMFFLFLTVYLFMKCIQLPSFLNFFCAGVALGLAMLDRSTVLVTGFLLIFVLFRYSDFKLFLKGMCIVIISVIIVVSPWLYRNKLLTGNYALVTSGKILWKGLLENSEGSNYLNNGGNYYQALNREEVAALGHMNAQAQNEFFLEKYKTILKSRPQLFVKLFLVKLKNYWWFRSRAGNEMPVALKDYMLWYKLVYVVMMVLLLLAFYFYPKEVFFVLFIPLLLSFFQAVFYVETRHRIIIEPFLLLPSLVGFYLLMEKMKRLINPKLG